MSAERLPDPAHDEQHVISGRTPAKWHQFLTTHNGEPAGHLEAPGSRYGRDADTCAWYAIAMLAIYEAIGSEPEEAESTIDWAMGLVVNDNEEVAQLVQDNLSSVPQEVIDHLDIAI